MTRALRPRNPNIQYAIPAPGDGELDAFKNALPTTVTLKRKRKRKHDLDLDVAYNDAEELDYISSDDDAASQDELDAVQRVTRSEQAAGTEPSAHTIRKKAFIALHGLEYLKALPRSEWNHDDGKLLTSYRRLRLGVTGNDLVVAWDECHISDIQAQIAEIRFKDSLASIASGRNAQARTLERKYPYPFSVKVCSLLVDLEISTFVDIMRAGMKYRTQILLGEARIKYEYIESMEGFTQQDLISWFVYYGIIVEPDKTISEQYVGSTHSSIGGWDRIFGYEKALAAACRGFVSCRLLEPFPTAALKAIQRGGQVFIRPLYVTPEGIPAAGPEQDAVRDRLKLVEGFFCDHRRCIRDVYVPHIHKGEVVGVLNDSEIVKYSWSLTPSYMEDRIPGLNKVSPLNQGHLQSLGDNRSGEKEKDRAIKRQPGNGKCLMCADQEHAWDMLSRDQREDSRTRARHCQLFGKLSWATQEWICPNCYWWIYNHETVKNNGMKTIQQLGIKSIEDLRAHKLAALQNNIQPSVEDGETCPLCDVQIVSTKEGTSLARKSKTKMVYAFLQGAQYVCARCADKGRRPGTIDDREVVEQILSRADISIAKEFFKARRGAKEWIAKYRHIVGL